VLTENREGSTLGDQRVVPEVRDGHYYRHVRCYEFAAQFTYNKDEVLDLGCGCGYGTQFLATSAGHVTGVDYDPEAIAYCTSHFSGRNLRFRVMDCRRLQFDQGSLDVVVTLQVFEHVLEWQEMLSEVRRVLKPNGVLVLSTPNRITTEIQERRAGTPHYSYHVNEVDAKQLGSRLKQFFASVDLFSMRRRGSALYSLLRRFDLLNLRLRIPLRLRGHLASRVGVNWGDEAIGSSDAFMVEHGRLRTALNLIAVCHK
jgi:SAM-dependent methyltransferase